MLVERSGVSKFVEWRHGLVRRLNAVNGQRGEISEKTLKAVNGCSLGSLFGERLALSRRRALGGFHNGVTLLVRLLDRGRRIKSAPVCFACATPRNKPACRETH